MSGRARRRSLLRTAARRRVRSSSLSSTAQLVAASLFVAFISSLRATAAPAPAPPGRRLPPAGGESFAEVVTDAEGTKS